MFRVLAITHLLFTEDTVGFLKPIFRLFSQTDRSSSLASLRWMAYALMPRLAFETPGRFEPRRDRSKVSLSYPASTQLEYGVSKGLSNLNLPYSRKKLFYLSLDGQNVIMGFLHGQKQDSLIKGKRD